MIGRRVLHYEITEKLGEGGMGVVYRAHDTKLDRAVALKFLGSDLIEGPQDYERLRNEARAAASLHHPHICTIYEINEFEGQTFIAMSFIEGQTLRELVLSDEVSEDEALRVITQIADGLNQAHARGIVHRDIKSANIMMRSDGHPFIMDFGLARREGHAKSDDALTSGGTSAYMAPEQARGDAVDQRTDIWSLGVVLYEMLAGQLPFRATYQQAVLYSILNEPHRSLKEHKPELSDRLVAIVDRCLAKDPDDRYQTIGALQADLAAYRESRQPRVSTGMPRWLGGAVLATLVGLVAWMATDFVSGKRVQGDERIPIAVVDFNNETGQAELDGLSGMLITALEQSRRLSVMTRTRMFDVARAAGVTDASRIDESLGQRICTDAGVGALVIPTIRKFGETYTIDLKVLDTKANKYVYTAEQRGTGAESIPGMIDELAADIRIDIKGESQESVKAATSVASVTTTSLEAYQKFFEGEAALSHLDFGDARKAFQAAVDIDSTFGLAYYRLAYTEWWENQGSESMVKNTERALALIDRIPEKERYLLRALSASRDGFEASVPAYREMQKIYPDDKEMLFGIGDAAFHSDNYDTAEVYFDRVLQLDPNFERALQHQTWTYARTENFEKQRDLAKRWAKVTDSANAWENLVWSYRNRGLVDSAVVVLDELATTHPRWRGFRRDRALFLAVEDKEAAIDTLSAIGANDTTRTYFWTKIAFGADLYPYFGQFDVAMSALRDAKSWSIAREDSFLLLQAEINMASNRFFFLNDRNAAKPVAAIFENLPEVQRNQNYHQDLFILKALSGDEQWVRSVLADDVIPVRTRKIASVIAEALIGNPSTALALRDSLVSAGTYAALPFDVRMTMNLALGMASVRAGFERDAIAPLTEVINAASRAVDFGAVYPIALSLRAEAFEALGEADRSLLDTRALLELWQAADPNLPAYLGAQDRLRRLTARSSM